MKYEKLSREQLLEELGQLTSRVEELENGRSDARMNDFVGNTGCPGTPSDLRIATGDIDDSNNAQIEHDYRSVVESAGQGICITQDGYMKYVNSAGAGLTGYSKEDLLSMPFTALVDPEDHEELVRIYMMRLRGEQIPPGHRFRIITKDRVSRWVESWSASITWNERPAVMSMIRDITGQVLEGEQLRSERVELDKRVQERTAELQGINEKLLVEIAQRERAQKALRDSEQRFRTLAEASFEGIAVSEAGMLLDVNDHLAQMLGCEPKELIGKPVLEFIAPDYRESVEIAQLSERMDPYEHYMVHKDGTTFPVEVRVRKALVDDREVRITAVRDITERKKSEHALRESMEKFRSIVENALAGIFTIDENYRFVYVNDEICRLTGYSREILLESDFRDLLTDENRSLVIDRYVRRQRGEPVPNRYELDIVRFDGETRRVEMTVATVRDASDRPRSMGQLIDITERRQTEEAVRKSERRLSEALQVARMGCWEYDVLQDLFTFNDQYYSLHQTTASRAGGYRMSAAAFARKYVHPEDAPLVGLAVKLSIETTDPDYQYRHEVRILTDDGTTRWVTVWFRIEKDRKGRTTQLFGVNQDISERKQAEEAMRQSERKYRELVQNANSIILRWNRKGEVTFLNEYGQKFFGYPEEEIVGQHVMGAIVPETETSGRDLRPLMEQICANPRSYEHNVNENIRRDGSRVWIEWTNKAIFDERSQLVEIFSVGTDITERRRTEGAIRNIVAGVSSEIGSKFFDSITSNFAGTLGADCTLIGERIDKEGVAFIRTLSFFLDGRTSNNIGLPLKGSPCEMTLAQGLCSCPRDVRSLFPDDLVLAKLGIEGYVGVQLSDSCGMPLGVMVALYRSPIENVEFAESILQIFAARTAAEIERKRVEEERLRLVTAIEQAGESILITDPAGRILYTNPAFEETTGYSSQEVLGETASILRSGNRDRSSYEDMWSTIQRGDIWRGRFTNRKKDGSAYEETATISPIKDESGLVVNYVMVGRDVTSEVILQKQLLQAQKMEAVGTLAGGVAHDFNNLLQAILGFSDLLLMNKGPKDPDRRKLEVIQQAARDGADLVSRILTFSRKADSKTRPIDLNAQIRKAQGLLRRTIPRMIDIRLVLAKNLEIINADPAQIEQMLLNLTVNAHHAMPDGGQLVIETRNVSLRDEYIGTHLGAKAGRYILLTVSDNGMGMEPELVDRIFEPFFTTKTNGQGTGLGLAMVHGIVSQHGGHISCYSEPGRGTSFKIYFPVIPGALVSSEVMTREMPAFGTETVLLVDDDERVREMARQVVEMGGYQVLTATNGERALEIYAARKPEIALVILDLIMPGMGGKRCLEELLLIDPDVRVLIASGYSSNGISREEKGAGARGFISKPYDAKDILTAIRRVLDRGHL